MRLMTIAKAAGILSWIGTRIGKPPGWERLVRMLLPPDQYARLPESCVVRDGIVFIVQPSVQLGWHVALFGSYEPELREIFRAVLPPGGVGLDIGANVGWHTLLMASLVGDQGRVLAAEPNPSIRTRLLDHLDINRLRQVDVIPFVIADCEGVVEFFAPGADDAASASGHVLRPEASIRGTMQLETRRLDTIASESQIKRLDLIKIDVEGFEWPVLQGGEQTIAKFRPHIVFEYDAAYTSRGGGDPNSITDFFRSHRYRLFAIGRVFAEAVELENWPNCANIWAVPLH
jgi:FkbM family methyltransferase